MCFLLISINFLCTVKYALNAWTVEMCSSLIQCMTLNENTHNYLGGSKSICSEEISDQTHFPSICPNTYYSVWQQQTRKTLFFFSFFFLAKSASERSRVATQLPQALVWQFTASHLWNCYEAMKELAICGTWSREIKQPGSLQLQLHN